MEGMEGEDPSPHHPLSPHTQSSPPPLLSYPPLFFTMANDADVSMESSPLPTTPSVTNKRKGGGTPGGRGTKPKVPRPLGGGDVSAAGKLKVVVSMLAHSF